MFSNFTVLNVSRWFLLYLPIFLFVIFIKMFQLLYSHFFNIGDVLFRIIMMYCRYTQVMGLIYTATTTVQTYLRWPQKNTSFFLTNCARLTSQCLDLILNILIHYARLFSPDLDHCYEVFILNTDLYFVSYDLWFVTISYSRKQRYPTISIRHVYYFFSNHRSWV